MERVIEEILAFAQKKSAVFDNEDRYTVLEEAGRRLQEEASLILAAEFLKIDEEEEL